MGCRIWTLPDGTEVHAHVSDDIGPESILAVEAVARAAAEYLRADEAGQLCPIFDAPCSCPSEGPCLRYSP